MSRTLATARAAGSMPKGVKAALQKAAEAARRKEQERKKKEHKNERKEGGGQKAKQKNKNKKKEKQKERKKPPLEYLGNVKNHSDVIKRVRNVFRNT